MKNADDMSPEELRALADQKEYERTIRSSSIAYLKHDLYVYSRHKSIRIETPEDYLTKLELTDFINGIKGRFEVILARGTEFTCITTNGGESWFDDNGWIENKDAKWAKKHLHFRKDL